ncbi:putative carbonic anhydrase 1 [Patella vulgata]|uniref:putative carbonic anhydrase 1 n=1 Tax=Patella vulgata TaxID=6465 RepID=UPI0024A7D46F|nr:putative carbonic anhydrase 1 [Patella vulgata]
MMAFKAVLMLGVVCLAQQSLAINFDLSTSYARKALRLATHYLPGHYNDFHPHPTPRGERALCQLEDESCFSYDPDSGIGPQCWFKIDFPLNKCCDERNSFQSPIDIPVSHRTYRVRNKLRYRRSHIKGELINNGINPKFEPEDEDVKLYGVPNSRRSYILDNVHLHFGPRGDDRQTEHTIGGENFDAEAHLVHHRSDFNNLSEASIHPGGIVVVAILFSKEEGSKSPAFEQIFNQLDEVTEFDDEENACFLENILTFIRRIFNLEEDGRCRSAVTPMFPDSPSEEKKMRKCLLHTKESKCGDHAENIYLNPNELLSESAIYYNYEGSLTSPTCTEAVTWLVAEEPTRISDETLNSLAALESRFTGDLISDKGNLRPTQSLAGRKVKKLRFRKYGWPTRGPTRGPTRRYDEPL